MEVAESAKLDQLGKWLIAAPFLAIGLLALVFKSMACFVRAEVYDSYPHLLMAFSVAGAALFLRHHLRAKRRGLLRPMRTGPFLVAWLLVSLVVGVYFTGVTMLGMDVAILETASRPVSFQTTILPRSAGRGCRVNYVFDDPPIARRVGLCGDEFLPKKLPIQSHTVRVTELVGALGARVQRIDLLP